MTSVEEKIEEILGLGERVQKNYERMFACLELADDMFCEASQDGFFTWLNGAWERTLGWNREELLAKPWLDFVHRDDVEETVMAAEVMKAKGLASFKNRYRCKNGSYRLLRWKTLKWEDGIAYAMAKDITDTQ